jgi:hypothetical protein
MLLDQPSSAEFDFKIRFLCHRLLFSEASAALSYLSSLKPLGTLPNLLTALSTAEKATFQARRMAKRLWQYWRRARKKRWQRTSNLLFLS